MCAQGGERKGAQRDKGNHFHFNSERARVRASKRVRVFVTRRRARAASSFFFEHCKSSY